MWRQQNNNNLDDFDQLMVLMSAKQMQEDGDFDNTKVMVNFSLQFLINCLKTIYFHLQLHPADRSSSVHECFFCGFSAPNRPTLLVTCYFILKFSCCSNGWMLIVLVVYMQAHTQLCKERPRWDFECIGCGNEYQSERL